MIELRIEVGKRVNQELLDEEIKAIAPKAVGSSLFGSGVLIVYIDSDKVGANLNADIARAVERHNPDLLTTEQRRRSDDKLTLFQNYPAEGDADTLLKLQRRLRALERACRQAGIIE
jgi:hypothetical protein